MERLGQPVLSVVIPTYNNEATLPEAIASVRCQPGPSREIIVVDDGSTDSTARVLGGLAGPDLHVIGQENAGPAAARNAGIAAAQGEWIALLDADDLWLPGKLEAQFAALDDHPDAGFCFAGEILRQADGTETSRECRPCRRPLLIELLKGNRFATSTAVIRRECFTAIGAFDPDLRTGEDWDMWLRLAARFDGVLVLEPLVLRPPAPAGKYSVDLLEKCTYRVLDRLFSRRQVEGRCPELAGLRRRVYAWHYSVLAKSYLRRGRIDRSGRNAWNSIRSHSSGLRCLVRGVESW